MDWWNVSVFGVIPSLTVIAMFCWKRRLLWAAPLVSAALAILISIGAMPAILENREYASLFFGAALPLHLAVAVPLTVMAYILSFLLSLRRRD